MSVYLFVWAVKERDGKLQVWTEVFGSLEEAMNCCAKENGIKEWVCNESVSKWVHPNEDGQVIEIRKQTVRSKA